MTRVYGPSTPESSFVPYVAVGNNNNTTVVSIPERLNRLTCRPSVSTGTLVTAARDLSRRTLLRLLSACSDAGKKILGGLNTSGEFNDAVAVVCARTTRNVDPGRVSKIGGTCFSRYTAAARRRVRLLRGKIVGTTESWTVL